MLDRLCLAQRGVTDVTILERGTVGSGGTGESSGVVRCHDAEGDLLTSPHPNVGAGQMR